MIWPSKREAGSYAVGRNLNLITHIPMVVFLVVGRNRVHLRQGQKEVGATVKPLYLPRKGSLKESPQVVVPWVAPLVLSIHDPQSKIALAISNTS
jgi:hypothetical protein